MRAVVQRVTRACVEVDGAAVAEIGGGLLLLVGVQKGDGEADAAWLAQKCAQLRVFEDSGGKMNLSLLDTGLAALAVSQFTLLGDARKGRRPGFDSAMEPAAAEKLMARFTDALRATGVPVQEGVFRTHMKVSLLNDGPVTILLDSRKLF
ncbi:MAG: D-aminoacyl-tRNA deacylase [Myxococcota bacterium]